MRILPAIVFSLLAYSSHALVDYSEPDYTPQNSGAAPIIKRSAPVNTVTTAKPSSNKGSLFGGHLDFAFGLKSSDVKMNERNGKVQTFNFDGHFQTQYNIFLDFSYWQLSQRSKNIQQESGNEKGNPLVLLGFNWLEFGSGAEAATVDFYMGGLFGQSGSDLATQRTEKIAGLRTIKRFNQFALGVGYEFHFNGRPDNSQEMEIGDMRRFSASLGWVVSPDIKLLLEANNYKISKSSNSENVKYLDRDINLSSISPKMHLNFSRSVVLEIGGTFRTRRMSDDSILSAKLWNLEGAYGNSLFAGLGMSL